MKINKDISRIKDTLTGNETDYGISVRVANQINNSVSERFKRYTNFDLTLNSGQSQTINVAYANIQAGMPALLSIDAWGNNYGHTWLYHIIHQNQYYGRQNLLSEFKYRDTNTMDITFQSVAGGLNITLKNTSSVDSIRIKTCLLSFRISD